MIAHILLVDDDIQGLASTRKILELSGIQVTTAGDGQQALEQVRSGTRFDVIVTDVRMPNLGGIEFLRALSLCGESTPVILMTAYGRVEDAVWAMKLGAVDFLTKPFKRQALLAAVEAAIQRARPAAPALLREGGVSVTGSGLRGSSAGIESVRELVRRVAPTSASILVTGESGTGKELVARLIHDSSPRSASGRFVALNCAAVPENLIESELFGFEKGAFTGATAFKEGLFEAAHGGTLLLDEIGDMPLALQAKLLRVLQEGEVRRIGATAPRKVDVRVVAATHRDLRESVRAGSFRQDLLFRLEVVEIQVPPLRERLGDLPELIAHFLAQASVRHGKEVRALSPEATSRLRAHAWPGNVRELANVIERAVIFSSGPEAGVSELPAHLMSLEAVPPPAPPGMGSSMIPVRLGTPLKDVEEMLIRKTLEATSGDKNMTAKLLGINSRTIYRKLAEREPEPEAGV